MRKVFFRNPIQKKWFRPAHSGKFSAGAAENRCLSLTKIVFQLKLGLLFDFGEIHTFIGKSDDCTWLVKLGKRFKEVNARLVCGWVRL